MATHPQEAKLKQLGESQRVKKKKKDLHAGEYGCRVLCLWEMMMIQVPAV